MNSIQGVGREISFDRPLTLTLRDYFAAHAPETPQDWFEPEMPPKPKVGHRAVDLGGGRKTWVDDHSEIDEWERTQSKQRLVQWPYAWADAVLSTRSK